MGGEGFPPRTAFSGSAAKLRNVARGLSADAALGRRGRTGSAAACASILRADRTALRADRTDRKIDVVVAGITELANDFL